MRRMHVLSLTSLVICYSLLSAYLLSSVLLNTGNSECYGAQLVWCGAAAVLSDERAARLRVNKLQDEADLQLASRVWNDSYPSLKFEDRSSANRPFKPVVIVTYQRCGSSFLGNLFNFDKNAFYVFEPLDSFYTAIYGTSPGWNVPSDIFAYEDGSQRPMPYDELIAVAEYLGHLLSCDVDRLPPELLAHGFWHIGEHRFANATAVSNRLAPCIRRLRVSVRRANARLVPVCGRRFSDRGRDRHEFCRSMLRDPTRTTNGSTDAMKLIFTKYREAMKVLRAALNTSCSPLYRSHCAVRPLRVAKLVRATMQSMKPLLDWLPDLRVIHLVRDPRPVALSRRDFHESARGKFSEVTTNLSERTIREASMYCRQVVDDIRWRRRLERQYPGRVYSLTYEQLVDNPVERASDIYRFIGETPSGSVLDNFEKLAIGDGNKTAKYLSTRWLDDRISLREFDDINELCSELFELHPEYLTFKPARFRTKELLLPTVGSRRRAIRIPARTSHPSRPIRPIPTRRALFNRTKVVLP